MAVTDYTGICVCRLMDGSINTVRVRLGDGNELEIDPASYFSRGAQPSVHVLPDCIEQQPRENRTGADLIAALQASPYRDIDIEPQR